VPLHIDIRLAADGGAPIVISKPDSAQSQAFRSVARKLIEAGVA
jgi:ATP-binding protein involved in chromosome partitioning